MVGGRILGSRSVSPAERLRRNQQQSLNDYNDVDVDVPFGVEDASSLRLRRRLGHPDLGGVFLASLPLFSFYDEPPTAGRDHEEGSGSISKKSAHETRSPAASSTAPAGAASTAATDRRDKPSAQALSPGDTGGSAMHAGSVPEQTLLEIGATGTTGAAGFASDPLLRSPAGGVQNFGEAETPGVQAPPVLPQPQQTTSERVAKSTGLARTISLVEGLMEGQMLTIFYLFKETYGFDPAPVGILTAITQAPFAMKPWLAYWVDSQGDKDDGGAVAEGALQKRMIMLGAVNALSTAGHLCISSKYFGLSFASLFAIRVGNCLTQTLAQYLVVTATRDDEQLQQRRPREAGDQGEADENFLGHRHAAYAVSGFFYYRAVGALISAYGSGALMHWGLSPTALFNWMAVLPFSIVAATVVYRGAFEDAAPGSESSGDHAEERHHELSLTPDAAEQPRQRNGATTTATTSVNFNLNDGPANTESVWSLAQRLYHDRQMWIPCCFLGLFVLGPGYDEALNFFFINRLHWTPEFLGSIQLAHHAARIVALAAYGLYLYRMKVSHLFVGSSVISCVLFATPALITSGAYETLHLNPKFLALAGEVLRDCFSWLLLMPIYTDCVKRFAPKGREATTFALVSFVPIAARFVNRISSAVLTQSLGITATNFGNLTLMIFLVSGSTLLPALVVNWDEYEDAVIVNSRAGSPAVERDEMAGPPMAMIHRAQSVEGAAGSPEDGEKVEQNLEAVSARDGRWAAESPYYDSTVFRRILFYTTGDESRSAPPMA